MTYKIVGYDPSYIEKQADLVWEVSGKWKYPYRTSIEALKKTYSKENFDPSTRFYAMENDQLVGYITSDVVRNKEKGDYGTLRFPLVKNDHREISSNLMEKAFERFKELGITRIRSAAGKDFGNTVELAEKYGFVQKNLLFKRTRMPIEELKISGNKEGVIDFDDALLEELKNIYETKMGMSKQEGKSWFNFALTNRKRKEQEFGPSRISWKMTCENNEISGFSYMHRSDQDPSYGGVVPFWSNNPMNIEQVIDTHLSAHIEDLEPEGLKFVGTFLIDELLKLEGLYSKFGFVFDSVYSFEKIL
ncbi:MAG: GNAT family N-acetyltransferase [Candidatus Heimdallarchaeota archaeon]